MFWLAGARFNLRFVQIFQVSLLPVMGFRSYRGNVQPMRRFHVRSVVEAADEGIGRDVYGPLDIAIAPQRKIRKPTISRRHAKLDRDAGRGHRQIEGVLELDLLRLREPEPAGDRSEEHTSELQSPCNLVCRLLLEKKKK